MSRPAALWVARAPACGLAAVGLMWGSFAGFVPDIKARVGASDAELGGALLMSALGSLIAMSLVPYFAARLGRHALTVFGALLCGAVLLPILPASVVALGAVLFGMGLTVALLDVSANVRISALEALHRRPLMNVAHAMFSFAFAGAAWTAGLARQAGIGLDGFLPVVALICLALVFAMRVEILPEDPAEDTARPASAIPWAAILLTGVVLFASFISENAIEAWSALHIERTLGAAPGEGSFGPAMLGLVMGFGRLSGQVLTARIGDARLIFGSALLAIAGALLLALAPSVPVALCGVGLAGVGLAVVVPSVNSILGARVTQRQRPHAISRAWMFGMVGFFVGPSMMGGIAELVGLRMSFVAVAGIVSLILPAVWALSWRRPRVATP